MVKYWKFSKIPFAKCAMSHVHLPGHNVSNTVIPIVRNNTQGLAYEIDINGVQSWYINGKQFILPSTSELREAASYASQSKRSRDSVGYDTDDNNINNRSWNGERKFISSPSHSNSLCAFSV